VTVLAVRGDPSLPLREEMHGFTVERLVFTGRFYAWLRRLSRGGGRKSQANGGIAPRIEGGLGLSSLLRDIIVKGARTMSATRFNVAASRRAVELNADFYHCHDFNAFYAGISAARKVPRPIIYDSHEIYAHLNVAHPTKARRMMVEFFERRWIRKASKVITVSDSIAEYLARRYDISRPTVILNVPSSVPEGQPFEVPDALLRGGVTLLYIGGIQRARGLEQAISALAELPDARLVMMGPSFPDEERALRHQVARLGLSERAVFVPPVPHGAVVSVSRHATLALVISQDVGLSHRLTIPNKLFEAIHAGLPVVTSDFPEIRRIVEENNVGVVCDAGDPHQIAVAVASLISDPGRLELLRQNARAAATRFTWPNEAEKLLALYRSIP
jgi:glycosyltransferase involved in cell wall biosynthesis